MDSILDETKNPNPNAVGAQEPSTPVRVKRDTLVGSARRGDEIITPASLVPLMGALHEYLDAERQRNARRMGMLGLAFVVILIVAAAYPIYLGRVLLTRMEGALGENQRATQRLANSAESGLSAITNVSAELRVAIEQQIAAMRTLSTAESGLSALTNTSADLRVAIEQQAAAMRMLSKAESGLSALTNASADLRVAIEQQASALGMLSRTPTSQSAVAAHGEPVQVTPAVAVTPPTPAKASVMESSPVAVRPSEPPPVTSAVTPPKSNSGSHLFMRRARPDSASPKVQDDAQETETGP